MNDAHTVEAQKWIAHNKANPHLAAHKESKWFHSAKHGWYFTHDTKKASNGDQQKASVR